MTNPVLLEPILKDSVVVTPLAPDQLIGLINDSFTEAKFPGIENLRNSNLTEEPLAVTIEFGDKNDWTKLEPSFLDQAPQGWASALSFFSKAAFRFYLPAYLIADVQQLLDRVNVLFQLTHSFTDGQIFSTDEQDRWMLNWELNRCSLFTFVEVQAIIAYLEYVVRCDDFYDDRDQRHAKQALNNYWYERGT
ncbi:MAG: hypothetical protein OXG24_02350 [Gammaproteobacteria bacterium]|nr:hypothetical protein [Gammaproteobacteria bacterium]